jgi:hypothetical protein
VSAGESTPDRARIEDLETQIRVLGEAHAATWERVDRIKSQLETDIQKIDNGVVKIDVKLGQKLEALDEKLRQALDMLDRRLVALEQALSDKCSSA